jgi:hypothetical protein
VAEAANGGEAALRPTLLTKRAADVLQRVERLMEDATRALVSGPAPVTTGERGASLAPPETRAASAGRDAAVRGN